MTIDTSKLSDTVRQVVERKFREGTYAYLWLHSSGDCILWPDEQSSENDDGANAVARWQLSDAEAVELMATNEVDETA